MRRKRGPYSKRRYCAKVSLLAADIERLTCRKGFDVALAALLMRLDALARREAYRPRVALALRMLADRLDDYGAFGFSTIPSVAMTPDRYVNAEEVAE